MDLEKRILQLNSIRQFNEMQQLALKKPWKEKSLVISSPTASGKTLIAELAALNCILNKKRKVVYTGPLRALAAEHYNECRRKYSAPLNVRIALSTGDLDSSSKHLQNYDLIFTTVEKLDSLIRHRADWLSSVGLLIVDEIHMLGSDRGPTLEVATAKLRLLNPKMQLLALSATIPNAREISEWLQAELIESNFRPIPLREGIYFDEEVEYKDRKKELMPGDAALPALVKDTLFTKKKQALIFANTRRRSESIARQLAPLIQKNLSEKEKAALRKESEKALAALEQPTEQCRALSSLISKGVAFHHAGLLYQQRGLVEEAFRSNNLKLIVATPTLSAGINTPSHTVVIPSLYRYTAAGMVRISVGEYKQMAGRASRPKYDSEGRGIVIARSEAERDELMEHYINGEIEAVESRLGYEPILRMHLLGLIASSFVFDLASMEEFFQKTFHALQFANMPQLFETIQSLLIELQGMGFITADAKRISATPLGARVSELYLDPASAFEMIEAMRSARKFSPFSYLFLFSNCTEMMPWLSVAKSKEAGLWEELQLRKREVPADVDREMFFDLNMLRKFNTSLLFEHWIQEEMEQTIMEQFGTQPGILHSKLQRCDWLCYSALELAKLLSLEHHYSPLSKLRKRLKHGVKEELVFLTEVRHIGRVRARRLWRGNIRTVAQLRKADARDLGRILGEAVAAKVKQALGQRKAK